MGRKQTGPYSSNQNLRQQRQLEERQRRLSKKTQNVFEEKQQAAVLLTLSQILAEYETICGTDHGKPVAITNHPNNARNAFDDTPGFKRVSCDSLPGSTNMTETSRGKCFTFWGRSYLPGDKDHLKGTQLFTTDGRNTKATKSLMFNMCDDKTFAANLGISIALAIFIVATGFGIRHLVKKGCKVAENSDCCCQRNGYHSV